MNTDMPHKHTVENKTTAFFDIEPNKAMKFFYQSFSVHRQMAKKLNGAQHFLA